MRYLRLLMILLAVVTMPALLHAIQPQPPSGFVPMDQVPPGEQIPAINMVAAAYGFVWLAVLGYVYSIAKRLKTVETELTELESRKR